MTLKQRAVNIDLLRSTFFFSEFSYLIYPFERLRVPHDYYTTVGLRSSLLRCFVTLMFTVRFRGYSHVSFATMCKILRVQGDEYALAKQLWVSPKFAKEAKTCSNYVKIDCKGFCAKLSSEQFDVFFWLEKVTASAQNSRENNSYRKKPNLENHIHMFSGKTKSIQRKKLKAFLKNLVIKTRPIISEIVLIMLGQIGWVNLDVLGLQEEDVYKIKLFCATRKTSDEQASKIPKRNPVKSIHYTQKKIKNVP